MRNGPSFDLDIAAEIERVDHIRAELHRQRDTPIRVDWKGVVLAAGLGALICVAGAVFTHQVGM